MVSKTLHMSLLLRLFTFIDVFFSKSKNVTFYVFVLCCVHFLAQWSEDAQVNLGVSTSMECDSFFPLTRCRWLFDRKGIQAVVLLMVRHWLSTLAATTHRCICRVYLITMYLVAVYVPVSLTCYLCRRINLILTHVVSALLRLLYGTHFLPTFVHVHFMALLSVS